MFTAAGETYLETQIATATPQKLRLMLIDGASRYARQAQLAWREERREAAVEAGIRTRAIIAELIAGIRQDGSPLSKQVAAIYAFLFQTLCESQASGDPARLDEVLAVLDEERQTWQAVCEQMPDLPEQSLRQQHQPEEILAPRFGGIAAAAFFGAERASAAQATDGFSIDA